MLEMQNLVSDALLDEDAAGMLVYDGLLVLSSNVSIAVHRPTNQFLTEDLP